MSPRITVLTAVYNGMPHLREAIESTLNQTYTDFEYIIIDDGSTDGSVGCIESYSDPRIRFIRNEKNLGTSDTMNKGIALAHAPYVARLDQDDVSLPTRLEKQLKYLESHPELAIISSWEYGIDAESRKVRNWKGSVDNVGAFFGSLFLAICPIWHPSIMFRRDAMIAVGGYKKEYQTVEDFELTMRLALSGHRAGIVPEYLVGQRHHGARQSVTKLSAQMTMRIKVHDEMLRRFFDGSPERRLRLGAFLRIEKDFWKQCRHKNDFFDVFNDCERIFATMSQKFALTHDGYATLRHVVYGRLGRGVRYARFFRMLPNIPFFFVFFILSPFLLPRVRSLASLLHEILHEMRYPIRLLTRGVEHRS